MDDKDFEYLMELADRLRNEKHTREEALAMFMQAGILDANENFTEPYKILQDYIK